jgi:hypothetical protein
MRDASACPWCQKDPGEQYWADVRRAEEQAAEERAKAARAAKAAAEAERQRAERQRLADAAAERQSQLVGFLVCLLLLGIAVIIAAVIHISSPNNEAGGQLSQPPAETTSREQLLERGRKPGPDKPGPNPGLNPGPNPGPPVSQPFAKPLSEALIEALSRAEIVSGRALETITVIAPSNVNWVRVCGDIYVYPLPASVYVATDGADEYLFKPGEEVRVLTPSRCLAFRSAGVKPVDVKVHFRD